MSSNQYPPYDPNQNPYNNPYQANPATPNPNIPPYPGTYNPDSIAPPPPPGPYMDSTMPAGSPSTSYGQQGSNPANPVFLPPPAPNAYQRSMTPPPAQPGFMPSNTPPPRRSSPGLLVLLIMLIVVVIIAGVGLFAFISVRNTQQANADATATAQTRSTNNATATTSASNATATNTANNVSATATASTVSATATAQVNATATAQVSATASVANTNPYPPNTGVLAYSDPLTTDDSSLPNSGACAFKSGAYHITTQQGYYQTCPGSASYSNITFEVQMSIVQGDCGGIMFRADTTNDKYYIFEVCSDGTYSVSLYTGTASTDYTKLDSGSSPAITAGMNQNNVVAVVANGSNLAFYVNHQAVKNLTDTTYKAGVVGFIADAPNGATEVTYINEKIWTL